MFNFSLRKQCYLTLNRCVVLSKSYSDSVVQVNERIKIKEFYDDFYKQEVKKEEFKKFFIEDLFLNKFQERVLEYPQLRLLKQVESLKKQSYLAQQLLCGKNDKTKVLCASNLKNSVTTLRTEELTGFKLPRAKQGFGYDNMEFSFMQETLGLSPSLSKSISENDDFGTHLISEYGNDSQKEKYLKRLASGEIITSFAHVESEPFALLDPDIINSTAELSEDKKNYIISGQKKWVYNANYADIFIISANTTTVNSSGVPETNPTLFLVPKDTPGLKVHEPISSIALKHLNICDISFDEIVVPVSSVLGNVQSGGRTIRETLSKGKLSNGTHCLPIMRELVNMTIKHCISADFFKKSKYENDYFKIKVAEIVSQVYAVESMTYLLIGRLDQFSNPDLFLESLIVKVFASENLQSLLHTCIEIIGQDVITSDSNWKQIVSDSQFYAATDITNDHLRLVLGMTGVQHALDHKNKKNIVERKVSDTISAISELFPHDPSKVISQGVLQGYLHCILYGESRALEDAVNWLYECTNYLIRLHGENVLNMHQELKALADIVIHIYAETAILGRASRAYCLGMELFEVDYYIASILIKVYHNRVNKLGRSLKYPLKRPKLDKTEQKILHSKSYSELFSIFNNLKIRK